MNIIHEIPSSFESRNFAYNFLNVNKFNFEQPQNYQLRQKQDI